MQISREIQLDYGHTIPNHYGFCNQIHGHRARVIATIKGEISKNKGDSSEGMVLDFKILKQLMMEYIHDVLDHGFAVWKNDEEDLKFITKRNKRFIITDEPPTAEYLAKWAFIQIVDKLPGNIILERIEWQETPTSTAVYTRKEWIIDNESTKNRKLEEFLIK